jgi:hypothetical protein
MTTRRPISCSGLPHVAAQTERELDELFGLGHFLRRDHAGDAEIDLREVVDRDKIGQERLGLECGVVIKSGRGGDRESGRCGP